MFGNMFLYHNLIFMTKISTSDTCPRWVEGLELKENSLCYREDNRSIKMDFGPLPHIDKVNAYVNIYAGMKDLMTEANCIK
jgi:hypothetical protein